VYIRGGSVLPMQVPGYTTYASRQNPWSLLVALSSQGTATGSLYIDDGESLVQNATLFVEFSVTNGRLYASVSGTWTDTNPLANVTVLGLSSQPANLTLNGNPVSSGVDFNSTSGALKVTGLNNATSGGAWSSDWVMEWS